MSTATQAIILASIFNAIQESIQAQMASHIEHLEANSVPEDILSDDTALYRISGWALKSEKRGI